MRWVALLVLLHTLTGCAGWSPAPRPVPPSGWARLTSRLSPAPAPLRNALENEASARRVPHHLPLSAEPGRHASDEETLTDLIAQSRRPALKPDQRFRQAFQLLDNGQSDPASAYASALSGHLLYPDFPKRHPLYARYFQERYPGSAVPAPADAVPFLLADRRNGARVLWLDPQRVRAIHLLFAGSGPTMASRFGHVALRLVVAPEGEPGEEAAQSNLFEHVVLGFMAHIDEFELNTVTALRGDYKAHLFASPFMDAYRNYAIDEFREVYSPPLALTPPQREQMVRELSEIHWRFSGNYNFFTRNCATLLQETLRVVMPSYRGQRVLAVNHMRPDRFFGAIRQTPLVKSDALDSLDRAEEEGHYFPSTRPYYEKAWGVVAAAMADPSFTDLESYLGRLPGDRMKAIAGNAAYAGRLASDSHLLEAQLLIEELALVRSERRFAAESARHFRGIDPDRAGEAIKPLLTDTEWALFETHFLSRIRRILAPVPRMDGIPLGPETLPAMAPMPPDLNAADRATLNRLLARVNPGGDPNQWQRVLSAGHLLDDTTENILILKGLQNDH